MLEHTCEMHLATCMLHHKCQTKNKKGCSKQEAIAGVVRLTNLSHWLGRDISSFSNRNRGIGERGKRERNKYRSTSMFNSDFNTGQTDNVVKINPKPPKYLNATILLAGYPGEKSPSHPRFHKTPISAFRLK